MAVTLALSTGCATIVQGTTAKIPVASDPTAADILVDGNFVGQTPATVVLKKTTDHLLTIQKVGYQPKSVPVVKTIGGAVWGNILAGGLIGWGVDASNGERRWILLGRDEGTVPLASGLARVEVASSSLVSRSSFTAFRAAAEAPRPRAGAHCRCFPDGRHDSAAAAVRRHPRCP